MRSHALSLQPSIAVNIAHTADAERDICGAADCGPCQTSQSSRKPKFAVCEDGRCVARAALKPQSSRATSAANCLQTAKLAVRLPTAPPDEAHSGKGYAEKR